MESTVEKWIAARLESGRPGKRGYGYWGDTPLGESWGIVFSYAEDANYSILQESNYETLIAWLSDKFEDDFSDESFGGAVGHVRHIMIRLINKNGKPSRIAYFVFNKLQELDDYPVWDENDWSMRECEAASAGNEQSIKESTWGESLIDLPEDYVAKTFEWLYQYDNDAIESADQNDDNSKGWIDEDRVHRAFFNLGYYDREFYDDSEWEAMESDMRRDVVYTLTPATNLPDPNQWFIACSERDMQPYRCDTDLRASFWEAFECAVADAAKHNETSITIEWNK